MRLDSEIGTLRPCREDEVVIYHGRWDESPDLSPTAIASVKSVATYEFAARYTPAGRALDIGCGRSAGGRAFAGKVGTLVNADLSVEGLLAARALYEPGAVFVAADACALPFAGNVFGLAIAAEVIEHVPPARTPDFLRELKRVVAPAGYVIVTTPNEDVVRRSGVTRCEYHENNFTPRRFQEVVRTFLGDAEFYGLAPKYSFPANVVRAVDIFNFRYLAKKALRIPSLEEAVTSAPYAGDLWEETVRRAERIYRVTARDFRRGHRLVAVYRKS